MSGKGLGYRLSVKGEGVREKTEVLIRFSVLALGRKLVGGR